ncbi:putative membrane protein [Roseovarius sp. MBR-51]
MPYEWTTPRTEADTDVTLSLWPHRSLPRRGFAAFVLATFTLITVPLYPLLGTAVLWGLLPFLLLAVGGVWWALEHSYRTARLREVLTIAPEDVHLVRTNPRGNVQEWTCNRYWAQVTMHDTGGPVAHYLTLKGAGREVEIGAFLSEEERKVLYGELLRALRPPAPLAG